MISLYKTKVAKEYIYIKKHKISLYSLEDISLKFNKSNNKINDMVNFFIEKINWEKFRFSMKVVSDADGKQKININQIKLIVNEMFENAISNFLNNPIDSYYIYENMIVMISNYGGKHYISLCPRYDFSK
jgi:hypothetical protein